MTMETRIEEIKVLIDKLKAELTGNLLEDCDIQAEIYNLKKEIAELQGVTIEQIEEDDEGCIYCSG